MLSSNTSYYLNPLGTPEPGHHIIHRAEHLPIRGGTCGHGDDFGSTIADIAQLFQPVHHRVSTRLGPLPVEGQGGLGAQLPVPLLNACDCGRVPITLASGQGCAGRGDVGSLPGLSLGRRPQREDVGVGYRCCIVWYGT